MLNIDSTLLSCPRCGEYALMRLFCLYWVECACCFKSTRDFLTWPEARNAWNKLKRKVLTNGSKY